MKHLIFNIIIAAFLVGLGYLVYKYILPKSNLLTPGGQNTQEKPAEKLNSVSFENCKIIAETEKGNRYEIGSLADSGSNPPVCISSPKYEISKSGRYLVFEDISGGVDLWIRVFSIDTQKINTVGVWGTSSLLDLEFLTDDKVVLFSGYPDIPEEQYVRVIDLPKLYENYPNNLDSYGNFLYELNVNIRDLAIIPLKGAYFELYQTGEILYVYGGSKDHKIKRGEFRLRDLAY